jgi:hypothetical protein
MGRKIMTNRSEPINDVNKILEHIIAFSKMGFITGYFRIENQIDASALPSVKLRRQFTEDQEKNRRSTDSYEAIENRKIYTHQIVENLEAAEKSIVEKFQNDKRKGTDAFFGSVVFMFLLAIIATQLIEDEKNAASVGLNILSVFPLIYIPLYIFMKIRVKRLYDKAHAAQDMSWVFPWKQP